MSSCDKYTNYRTVCGKIKSLFTVIETTILENSALTNLETTTKQNSPSKFGLNVHEALQNIQLRY
ncbi:hypothetical protein BpHYR1_012225 [Brachionus plicatilis]|uniref:Uncharacterized protein n=1 Tax=Brachionus plicatilis TaxID=10195 RepID=A0A3M7P2K2_BRAPC|nr:hypothetical protein BpHYR1_012225 [Brachionus plicatilis]